MKVVFDTNIYISWIRERKYSELLLDIHTRKYLSNFVLMELWAGVKTKQGGRVVETLQKPYISAQRIIPLHTNHFITLGHIISDLPDTYKQHIKHAGFINDIGIAVSAMTIGAVLYTANKKDFKLINSFLPELKVNFV